MAERVEPRAALTAARKASGYTQEALADALHVDRSTVVRWEAGTRSPQAYLRPRLARLLDCTRGQLSAYLEVHDAPDRTEQDEAVGGPSALAWLSDRAGWRAEDGRRRYRAAAVHLDAATVRADAARRSRVPRSAVAARLDTFYGAEPMNGSAGLYTAMCDGDELTTSVVTRPEWVGLSASLREDGGETLVPGTAVPARLDADTVTAAVARLVRAERLGHRLYDAPIYRLDGLDVVDGRPAAQFGTSTFLEYACTADLLEPELLGALADEHAGVMPLRSRFLPDLASVLDPSSRLCAGGVLALCAVARPPERAGEPGDYALILQRRSGAVLNAADQRAVIPKGFHQPLTDAGRDVALGATVLREMEEELFGRADVDTTQTAGTVAAPMHRSRLSEPMRWLVDAPADVFRAECTGVGFNLVSGNYEFAGLVVVDDDEFWRRFGGHIETSWETSGVELVSSRDRVALAGIARDERWSNEGLFAFLLGLQRLRAVGGGRVDVPDVERR